MDEVHDPFHGATVIKGVFIHSPGSQEGGIVSGVAVELVDQTGGVGFDGDGYHGIKIEEVLVLMDLATQVFQPEDLFVEGVWGQGRGLEHGSGRLNLAGGACMRIEGSHSFLTRMAQVRYKDVEIR